jgi:hypothetical protein
VACHADDGFSGGLVTDYEGHVKGMVVGGRGRSMLLTTFIPSESIHDAVILLHRGRFGFSLWFRSVFYPFCCTRFPNNRASLQCHVRLWQ